MIWSSNPACKCLSEELKADPLRNVYFAMFVVILFFILMRRKQQKCPLIGEEIKKKWKILFDHRKKEKIILQYKLVRH